MVRGGGSQAQHSLGGRYKGKAALRGRSKACLLEVLRHVLAVVRGRAPGLGKDLHHSESITPRLSCSTTSALGFQSHGPGRFATSGPAELPWGVAPHVSKARTPGCTCLCLPRTAGASIISGAPQLGLGSDRSCVHVDLTNGEGARGALSPSLTLRRLGGFVGSGTRRERHAALSEVSVEVAAAVWAWPTTQRATTPSRRGGEQPAHRELGGDQGQVLEGLDERFELLQQLRALVLAGVVAAGVRLGFHGCHRRTAVGARGAERRAWRRGGGANGHAGG